MLAASKSNRAIPGPLQINGRLSAAAEPPRIEKTAKLSRYRTITSCVALLDSEVGRKEVQKSLEVPEIVFFTVNGSSVRRNWKKNPQITLAVYSKGDRRISRHHK